MRTKQILCVLLALPLALFLSLKSNAPFSRRKRITIQQEDAPKPVLLAQNEFGEGDVDSSAGSFDSGASSAISSESKGSESLEEIIEQNDDATPPEAPTKKKKKKKSANDTIKKQAPDSTNKKIAEEKPAASPETKDESNIYLNFENAELKNLIDFLRSQHGMDLISDPKIAGHKVSLTMQKPLNKKEAWNLLYTLCEMAGYTIVKYQGKDSRETYEITAKNNKFTKPLSTFINVNPETLPDNDETIRYLTFFKKVSVNDIRGLLSSMLSNPHQAIPFPQANGIVIVDQSYTIKSAMKVARALDEMGLQESVVVMHLQEANAREVAELFKSLTSTEQSTHPLARFLSKPNDPISNFTQTKIVSEERTNSLILIGPKSSTEKIEAFIKEHVDTKLVGIESPLHIYELQHTDARQVADVLRDVIAQPQSTAGEQASKYGAVRSGVKYFKPMTIKAEDDGNRLIISTSDRNDWDLIKKTIKSLDKPQPQVAIEALVVTVDNSDGKGFGGQIRNKKTGQIGNHIDFQSSPLNQTIFKTDDSNNPVSLLGNMITGLTSELGKTVLTFGSQTNIWGIFNMLRQISNTSVIAQPFLTTGNKYKARIAIGETRRQRAQESLNDSGAVAGTGFKDRDANLELIITPQININGIINLKISLKVDSFGSSAEVLSTRQIDTSASVANGQVFALGGLVKTKVTEVKNKTPILGDIPLIGWLFSNKTKTITKQNILVFCSPTIIKPRSQQGYDLYTKMKLSLARKVVDEATPTARSVDPIQNWFFSPESKAYSEKISDYASAQYQPTTVDIKHDPYYRSTLENESSSFDEHAQQSSLPLPQRGS